MIWFSVAVCDIWLVGFTFTNIAITVDVLFIDNINQPSRPVVLERQTSHTTKVYEEGQFHEGHINDMSLSVSSKQNINGGKIELKVTNDGIPDHGYQSGSGRSSTSTHSPTG